MKKVLISIHPRWCAEIFNGQKTVEVRRTRPKLEPPFEVLVYETKGQFIKSVKGACTTYGYGRGKVIGSFVCDKTYDFFPWGAGVGCTDKNETLLPPEIVVKETCLTEQQIIDYLENGNGTFEGYGWHITAPKLFDNPRELGEFVKPCDWNYDCCTCKRAVYELTKAEAKLFYGCDREITRPPQSWMYVEELQ